MTTTNYFDTFIEVSEDCPVTAAVAPPIKEPKTVAQAEYGMLANSPYQYTSDDIAYETKGEPKGIGREDFFSKDQACFRSSALTKRYGWGVHCNKDGKIALYAVDSPEYKRLAADESIKHIKAMRSKRR